MKKRWLWYSLTGIAFGIFDFYYQAYITNTFHPDGTGGQIAWLFLILSIWLVPIVPVIFHEANISHSALRSALASTLTWCWSVAAYYLTNGFQLAFIGIPGRPELHISSHSDPYFWENWKNTFLGDLVGGSIEWLVVAVVGGMLIGFTLSYVVLRLKGNRRLSKASSE